MRRYVILDNIRSAHNVGSIFRTADGAGVHKLFLIGQTPSPVDRFGRVQPEIQKTSLGASASIEWEYTEEIDRVLTHLRNEGVTLVAVEQHTDAMNYKDFSEPQLVAYIFGHEVDGVSEAVCDSADAVISIPMLGKKESLNVSVAAGIILYRSV